MPTPVFNLTPAATVDEGNNWINISWGPLALTHPVNETPGQLCLANGSPAIDYIGTRQRRTPRRRARTSSEIRARR